MNGIVELIVIGIAASFIASIVFAYYLRNMKPKIEISENIAFGTMTNNTPIYRVKVVNKSKRDAIELRANLLWVRPDSIRGGYMNEFHDVILERNEIFILKGITNHAMNFTEYDFSFKTKENLHDKLSSYRNSYIIFQINVKDSHSGFSKVFTKRYDDSKTIKNGVFEIGESFKIN